MIKMKTNDLKINFNLFRLHDKERDKNPHKWILVNGKKLTKEVKKIFLEIVKERGVPKDKIYQEFSNILKTHKSTAKRHFLKLNKDNQWLALCFIENILIYWKKYVSNNLDEFKKLNNEIQSCFEELKIGQYKSKPVKVIENLTEILCKFAGAHAADGHLSKKNGIILEDEDKLAVEVFNRWIKELFGIEGRVFKAKNENGWRFELYNKVISHYLRTFFNFPIGKKSAIVDIPTTIKSSCFNFQKAFVCGAFTFDGSVSVSGYITYTTYSKNLAKSLHEILKKTFKSRVMKTDKGWNIRLKPSSNSLWVFEKDTTKYRKLRFILSKKIKQNPFLIRKIEYIASTLKIFDLRKLSEETGLKQNSLVAYIKILLKTDRIKETKNNEKILSELIENRRNTPIFLKKENNDRLFMELKSKTNSKSFQQLSDKLGIPASSTIRWKNRQNGISLLLLREWSHKFGINLNDLLKDCQIILGNRKFYECPGLVSSKV